MKQKILICGATGFIGRNMLESFIQNDNFDIRATWHKNANPTESYNGQVEWIHADLTKAEDVKKVVDGRPFRRRKMMFVLNVSYKS